MLKYLVITLCDTAVSYCHYTNPHTTPRLIAPETLRRAVRWAMLENLSVQFVYPVRQLPAELKEIIDTIDHTDIVPAGCDDRELLRYAEVIVADSLDTLTEIKSHKGQTVVARTTMEGLLGGATYIADFLPETDRLNIVVTDAHTITDSQIERYPSLLAAIMPALHAEYEKGHPVQLNLLTDRMMLMGMNNCNAGHESLTLSPDGEFYVCGAFWAEGEAPAGNLTTGPDVKNPQLYRLDHAPICRGCDAWHCRRCVWLNRHYTLEVNTPGRQQCVVSHHERAASARLLASIRTLGSFLPGHEITPLPYLDPFDKIISNS